MAVKKTLLEIVKDILSDLDSEDITSIDDTIEAGQVAKIVESVFYDLVSTRELPEHLELLKLTALADSSYPTHFLVPDNVARIETIWYDVSDDDSFEYKKMNWCEPLDFLRRTDALTANYTTVSDKNGGTKLRIENNKHPSFYTSFDEDYIVFNAHKTTVDSTLTEAKIRVMGKVIPVFDRSDSYVPDIDNVMFPRLISEASSYAFDVLKGGTTLKVEQRAKRQKNFVQNDQYKQTKPNERNDYGR